MTITTLIDGPDNFEVIRDKLQAILVLEFAAQQALATGAAMDPTPWDIEVFLERANPWDGFDENDRPFVNIEHVNTAPAKGASNKVSMQVISTYHLDCYALGKTEETAGGHTPGDKAAALESHRVARLTRQIIFSSVYHWLGLKGIVGSRFLMSLTSLKPQQDGAQVKNVQVMRILMEVQHIENAPQFQGDPIEEINIEIERSDDDLLLAEADFDFTP